MSALRAFTSKIRRLDAETSANADKAKKQDEQETDGTLT
jgi:hypothetical protein